MVDGQNSLDQAVKNDLITYGNIWKITTGQWNDWSTRCLLNYLYLKNYYKMITIDLSKQQALDAAPKIIQQINFTASLERDGSTTMFFIIEEAKETILDILQGTVKILWIYFTLIKYQYITTQYNIK